MSEQRHDILVRVDHLKKYFPVKGVKGPGVQAVERSEERRVGKEC